MTQLRTIAIIAIVAASAAVHADVRDEPVGGGGGGAFAARCAFGQLLTGVELHVGDDVDAIRPLCVLAYGPGQTTAVMVSQHGYEVAPRFDAYNERDVIRVNSDAPNAGGLQAVGDRLWYGGGGGSYTKTLVCPGYIPSVVRINIEAEGESTVVVHEISIECDKASPVRGKPEAWANWAGAPPSRYCPRCAWGPNHVKAASTCPAGTVGVGLHGRSGIWLDAVGIICDAPRYAPAPPGPPPPPPAKSAAEIQRERLTQAIKDDGTRPTGSILAITPKTKGTTVVSALGDRPGADVFAMTPPSTMRAHGGTPASVIRLSLMPAAPAAGAAAMLKAEGISPHCDGVTLRFGDGTADEFVPLATQSLAQQIEHAHRFARRGAYTIEATTTSRSQQCAPSRATLGVVVK